MKIKVPPSQIPIFWECIKFAVVQTGNPYGIKYSKGNEYEVYFNKLLLDLLNEDAQCFVQLDVNRKLELIVLTQIERDKISGERRLLVHSLYSWRGAEEREWTDRIEIIKRFAEKEDCSLIFFDSSVKRLQELAAVMGFEESWRRYIYKM